MSSSKLFVYAAAFAAFAVSNAQFPPTPKDVTTKHSSKFPGVSISYKETCLCETEAKSWAGYVHMPAPYINSSEYNASLFFWYFQARIDPQNAPTTIYFAGGPGESAMYGALNDGGPCVVLDDSNGTEHNPWSMNTHSNMLYVDQPLGTGFSYDTLVKSTLDLIGQGLIQSAPFSSYNGTVPPQNSTFYYGILPSSDPTKTTPTSVTAAKLLWHFSQIWFTEFPGWTTHNKRINLWGNSYGGFFTLISGQYFLQQNEEIKRGNVRDAIVLPVDAIGFTNGGIDFMRSWPLNPEYLYNNTYDFEVIPKELYEAATHNFTKSGGCIDQIQSCRQLGYTYDPDFTAANDTVNDICDTALNYCYPIGSALVTIATNRSMFDIAHIAPDPFPSNNLAGFLNRDWVQEALGVPVNFTADSGVVTTAFATSADFIRAEGFKAMEYLLDAGIRLTLINGDRDPDVPWTTAEALSLEANWPGAHAFRHAGYEYVTVNGSYHGGLVRQHGKFSFVRVFQSGHDVAAYQPETNFRIFNRAIQHYDIATGKHSIDSKGNSYSSRGPSSSWFHKERLPPSPPWACYIYVLPSCTLDQQWALGNGTAVIQDWYVTEPAGSIAGTVTGST